MPPVIGLVLLGAGIVAGYKAYRRYAEATRPGARGGDGSAGDGAAAKDLGRLELDPSSGVYRPKQP